MARKQMKRRIFSGATCEQIIYLVPSGVRDPFAYDPEDPRRKRFKTEAERAYHRAEISRRNHYRAFQENFGPGDIYSTLTFDDDWEVHTFQEARQVRRNFIRALQRACPEAVIFLYMGRGKATQRIHFHMVSHGVPKELIVKKWKYGSIRRFAELRAHNYYEGVDHGADFAGLANYLWRHWTEEVGGHRWFATKNARKPEKEAPTEVLIPRGYSLSRPPRAPKGYMLVEGESNQFGYLYFKYVRIPEPPPRRSRPPATEAG